MHLPAIHAYLRASVSGSRDTEQIGPFLASFSRRSSNPFLSYAIPDDGATPTIDDVDALVGLYRRRDRRPRLEYIPVLAPAVEQALRSGGFVPEGRLVLMEPLHGVLAPALPDGIELVRPASPEELRGARTAQGLAYGEAGDPSDEDVDSLARTLRSGGGAILARTHDAQPVGAGECTPVIDGVSEITSIGVVEDWRRRGIAAAICAALSDLVRELGATSPFLMANEAESRVYARVGFMSAGEMLHISRD